MEAALSAWQRLSREEKIEFQKEIDKQLAARKLPGPGKYQCYACKEWCESYRHIIRTFDDIVVCGNCSEYCLRCHKTIVDRSFKPHSKAECEKAD
jgi:hypothetical protein